MSIKSILLGLDGSAQSRYAAELAWSIARVTGARVDAQHVVDTLAAWDLVEFDLAGFIGSNPYFSAHETICNCLQSVGQNLVNVYKDLSAAQGIPGDVYLDEGTTVREICVRASEHDLVITGHRSEGMESPSEDKRKLPRRSLAETLTHYINKPLLVVQDRCKLWSSVRVMLSTTKVPAELISSCLSVSEALSLNTSVRYVYPTDKDDSDDLETTDSGQYFAIKDIAKQVPKLAKAIIDVRGTQNIHEFLRADAEQNPDTLLVIPVTEVAGMRRTALGPAPELIIRYMYHNAVLLWIEESKVNKKANPAAASRSA